MPFVSLSFVLVSGDCGYFEQHGEDEETSRLAGILAPESSLLVLLNTEFSTCFSCLLMGWKVPSPHTHTTVE